MKRELEAKKKELKERFNQLSNRQQTLQDQLAQVNQELLRIQGAHREIDNLIKNKNGRSKKTGQAIAKKSKKSS